jgi:hypothetical protein
MNIYGTSKIPWYYSPFFIVFRKQIDTIIHSQNTSTEKFKFLLVLFGFQLGQLITKASLKLLRSLAPARLRKQLAVKFYWKFMHNPNIDVIRMSSFLERNILPMVGLRSTNVDGNIK